MDNYTITNFINEQLRDISRDLKETQIEIQINSQLFILCYCGCISSWVTYMFWLYASFNDISEDIELQFRAFQEAKYYYDLFDYYGIYLDEFTYSLDKLRKLEQLTREDYAELMLVKEDGYNMNEFTTFMYRNAKRFESLFEIIIEDEYENKDE